MNPNDLFPDITDFGEACHAAAFRLTDTYLTLGQYPDEVDEGCNVHLDGPDLGEHLASGEGGIRTRGEV